jgi:hypothetical protein
VVNEPLRPKFPQPDRRYAPWQEWEDRLLAEFDPADGVTLRAVARRLKRSYYACRLRRKRIQSGTVVPGRLVDCPRCSLPLPPGQRRGHCQACTERNKAEVRLRRLEEAREQAKAATLKRSRWSVEDDARLLEEGVSVELARELGRTVFGLYSRQHRLIEIMHREGVA